MKSGSVIGVLLFSVSSLAAGADYYHKAKELISQQNITRVEHYASSKPFFAINGRKFAMTLEEFNQLVADDFQQCNDQYSDNKSRTVACQKKVYKGVHDWVAFSKDPFVNEVMWATVAQEIFFPYPRRPEKNIINFSEWAAQLGVEKSRVISLKR